jgi:hypothetical protein
MDEANGTLQQAPEPNQAQRQSMSRAVMVLARQRALKEAKRQLAARGLKLANYSHREIVVMAEEIILADAQRRAEIIAEAKAIVAVWEAEGYFRPRRAKLHKARRPDLQALPLCEYYDRNGATQ